MKNFIYELKFYITVGLLVIVPCISLYIIQRTVCAEMQEIMRNTGSYNIFTGCTLQVGQTGEIEDLTTNGEK